jgi:hypothetical protein
MSQTSYSYGAFHGRLRSIRSRLAELRYIDDVLAHPGVTRGFVRTGITFDLGWTYPFEMHLGTNPNPSSPSPLSPQPDEARALLVAYRDEAASWAAGVVEGAVSATDPLTVVLPSSFAAAAEDMSESVAAPLSTLVDDDFGGLQNTLADWKGAAAEAFATDFYQPFGDCTENQAWLASEIALLLAACKATVDLGCSSLMNLVVGVDDTLDDQLRKRHDDNISASDFAWVGLASTVTGLLSLVTVAAPPVSVSLAAISTVSGYASGQVPAPSAAPTAHITEVLATGLADVLVSGIEETMTNTDRHWTELRSDAIADLSGHVEALVDRRRLACPRPAILDGIDPGDFHHVSSDQYT